MPCYDLVADIIMLRVYTILLEYNDCTRFPVITNLNDAKGPYNCVIMMNFLHEVEPQEWKNLFHDLFELMESEAYLFFVEVTALSQGEMPNSQGYFVFGKEELGILFRCSQGMFEIKSKENQKSSCILIPRSYLKNVTKTTVRKAIIHLRDRMLNEIKLLREAAN